MLTLGQLRARSAGQLAMLPCERIVAEFCLDSRESVEYLGFVGSGRWSLRG